MEGIVKFIFDENNLAEYMAASKQIDFMHPAIDAKAKELLGDIPESNQMSLMDLFQM